MPSYPSDVWNDEGQAWMHLARLGFTQYKYVIRPPYENFNFDYETTEAVNYLCGEWDWAYETTPAKAIEARRAETGTGSVHESAVP